MPNTDHHNSKYLVENDSNYILNRIGEHKREDLLQFCYDLLDSKKDEMFPIWHVFLIMKWTYLYSERKYPTKELNQARFARIYNAVNNLSSGHVSSFFKDGKFDRAFAILFNQQFYFQKPVRFEVFATQLKIYCKIEGKYNILKSFIEKTGIAINEFIFLLELVWLYLNRDILNANTQDQYSFINTNFLDFAKGVVAEKTVNKFINHLLLDPSDPIGKIGDFKRGVGNKELQPFEMTFFTLFPFQLFKGEIRIIHKLLFNHTANYYIHDYLKTHDPMFGAEFGRRFEKYIELGIKEMNCNYKSENDLKRELATDSKLVDYFLEKECIFIECKAMEMQAVPSTIPSDELLYSSLKDSILKAYFDQILTVAKSLSTKKDNWGLIITYKEFFWNEMVDLFELGKDKFENYNNTQHCKPENVFIIDIHSWDRMIGLIKNNKATLIEILKKAKENNSSPETKKALFGMHLDFYEQGNFNLSYLESEIKELTEPKE